MFKIKIRIQILDLNINYSSYLEEKRKKKQINFLRKKMICFKKKNRSIFYVKKLI